MKTRDVEMLWEKVVFNPYSNPNWGNRYKKVYVALHSPSNNVSLNKWTVLGSGLSGYQHIARYDTQQEAHNIGVHEMKKQLNWDKLISKHANSTFDKPTSK